MTNSIDIDEAWRSIPGEYYDWQETMQPESPYNFDYSQTLTMKLGMAIPDGKGGSKVFCTFEQALRYIVDIDRLTRGIPKIIYLVGWQYNGHDDRYPAWDEVNVHLKRPQDSTAKDSYLWLAEAAKRYNTTVSVHVNMTDAYDNSPHWDLYMEHDLISRNEDGSLLQIGNYNNMAAYQIFYKKEWESGIIVQRIEKLISLLELDKAGTVHLDAYFPRANVFRGVSQEEESSYMRRTIRYFRSRGIDVTSENFAHHRNDPFIGLQPWCWWFDQNQEKHFLERPAKLLSGAAIRDYSKPGIPRRHDLEFLFGAGVHGEDVFWDQGNEVSREDWHDIFMEQICTRMLQYQYLNSLDRIKIEGEGDNRVVHYSGGHSVHLADHSVRRDSKPLRVGDDVLFPALWQVQPELIAFSKSGYSKKAWSLPPDWNEVAAVDIYRITAEGLSEAQLGQRIVGGLLELSLAPGMAISIIPSQQ
ncbi:endo-alpha-N-acetylgalactosaminidase family protein [Paenibacillus sp. NRS-1760]|uniref:endo-alpha-N-acetylgalactosaminidase family protein n=1 Tax=Paenibacillus sp. NRS-1760 TaxID=3233902 RepID=UPI003D2AF5AE